VKDSDGVLTPEKQTGYIDQYRVILKEGEKESSPPIPIKGQRGKLKEANLEIYWNAYKTMKMMYSGS